LAVKLPVAQSWHVATVVVVAATTSYVPIGQTEAALHEVAALLI
jgi:hypothetical protein